MGFEREIRAIFQEIDADCDNVMTLNDFEVYLKNEQVKARFRLLGINVVEAHAIFRLIDIADAGSLGIDEFVTGCFRIKALAVGVDFSTLLHENKRIVSKVLSEIRRLDVKLTSQVEHVVQSMTCSQETTPDHRARRNSRQRTDCI